MLAELAIRDFAIIDTLDVELAPGMTVLSGETGAGKSILVDALSLILGDRAEADVVRDGRERADITARFSLADAPGAEAWLTERELDGDGECVIRRVVAREGRSRSWINGQPAPARDLKTLGELLVDIHGQHAHQSLLRGATQRELLDEYAGHGDLLDAVAQAAQMLREIEREIADIEQIDAGGDMRIDLLRYQVGELEALALAHGELEAIEAEHKRLASAERLIADGQRAWAVLFEAEDAAAVDQLGVAERLLVDLHDIDTGFAEAADLVASARIQAQEAADALRHHVDGLDVDPERFAQIEARLSIIHDLARKHRCAPAELPELADRLTEELTTLEGAGERLQALKQQREAQNTAYRSAAATLSAARKKAAKRLAAEVTAILRTLGMPEGEFEIVVQADEAARPGPTGTDTIEYRVTANPGQAARALERVASGGELSRISLAIEVVAASGTRVPTLVFDEVDTGIGGGVAEIVGRQLRKLGAGGQSLCVTHLPQVAALAEHHLHVAKHIEAGQTSTQITALTAEARVEELARMLGGIDITAQTRAHAQDMIRRAMPAGSDQSPAV